MEFEVRLHRIRAGRFSDRAIREHVRRLAELDDAGRLIAAGPAEDGTGGVILARFDDAGHAQAFADSHPFVTGGWETAEVRPWQHAHRRNHYLVTVPSPPPGCSRAEFRRVAR